MVNTAERTRRNSEKRKAEGVEMTEEQKQRRRELWKQLKEKRKALMTSEEHRGHQEAKEGEVSREQTNEGMKCAACRSKISWRQRQALRQRVR